jgi:hypothetical protein
MTNDLLKQYLQLNRAALQADLGDPGNHPVDSKLLALVEAEGAAQTAANESLLDHIAGCSRCFARLDELLTASSISSVGDEADFIFEENPSAESLAAILQDRSRPGWVRELAAVTLSELSGEAVIEALEVASSDPIWSVRRAAQSALESVRPVRSQRLRAASVPGDLQRKMNDWLNRFSQAFAPSFSSRAVLAASAVRPTRLDTGDSSYAAEIRWPAASRGQETAELVITIVSWKALGLDPAKGFEYAAVLRSRPKEDFWAGWIAEGGIFGSVPPGGRQLILQLTRPNAALAPAGRSRIAKWVQQSLQGRLRLAPSS